MASTSTSLLGGSTLTFNSPSLPSSPALTILARLPMRPRGPLPARKSGDGVAGKLASVAVSDSAERRSSALSPTTGEAEAEAEARVSSSKDGAGVRSWVRSEDRARLTLERALRRLLLKTGAGPDSMDPKVRWVEEEVRL